MEKKEPIKISLSTFFLTLAIIVIIIMGYFIFNLYNDKVKETEKVEELRDQIRDLSSTMNTLKENVNSTVESPVDIENDSNTLEKTTAFTEEQVKVALANYLELQASINPLDILKKEGKINYDSTKSSISTDGTIITNVKFSEYKEAMLNYVTETEFERNWTKKIDLGENGKGYLTHGQLGGMVREYTIKSVTKVSDDKYSAKTTSMIEKDNSTKVDKTVIFAIKSSKGKCVIDSINE